MTLKYNFYFDFDLEKDEVRWFEHSNIGFKGLEDERPLFKQYDSAPDSTSWSGPRFRLIPEVHDLLYRSFSDYRIRQQINPDTMHPFIRCEACNIEDEALIIMKLTWNIVVHKYDVSSF